VGGEVKIDTSAERDPDQTIRKMQQVKRAALAPANPSGTDRAVAARASQIELQARMEKAQQIKDENSKNDEEKMTGVQSNAEIQSNTKVQLDHGSLDSRGGNPYQWSKNHTSPLGHQINLSA
jgi:hypothetical protein